jgi:hypothetical protein
MSREVVINGPSFEREPAHCRRFRGGAATRTPASRARGEPRRLARLQRRGVAITSVFDARRRRTGTS